MADVPRSEVCLCGGTQWHAMIDRVLWCKRCGCLRFIFEEKWLVPLDRAGELPVTAIFPRGDEEPKTDPGTPGAKRGAG